MSNINYRITKIITVFLVSLCGAATAGGWEESSNNQYVGVGGWRHGRSCPTAELLWRANPKENWTTTFIKSKDGKTSKLGSGIAIFSPDCKMFWFVDSEKQNTISIFETEQGKKVREIEGRYPEWSPDSQSIIVSRKKNTYQLWSVPVHDQSKETKVIEVTDHDECGVFGDSIDWHPVIFVTANEVKWVYSIKATGDPDPARITKPAKTLTIDLTKKSLVRSENSTLECSF